MDAIASPITNRNHMYVYCSHFSFLLWDYLSLLIKYSANIQKLFRFVKYFAIYFQFILKIVVFSGWFREYH